MICFTSWCSCQGILIVLGHSEVPSTPLSAPEFGILCFCFHRGSLAHAPAPLPSLSWSWSLARDSWLGSFFGLPACSSGNQRVEYDVRVSNSWTSITILVSWPLIISRVSFGCSRLSCISRPRVVPWLVSTSLIYLLRQDSLRHLVQSFSEFPSSLVPTTNMRKGVVYILLFEEPKSGSHTRQLGFFFKARHYSWRIQLLKTIRYHNQSCRYLFWYSYNFLGTGTLK